MRYLLGFLAVIGLIIVVVILIVRGLSGGNDTATSQESLTKYTHTDAVMRMTIEGPINSESAHQGVRITVGRDESKIEALEGYNLDAFDSQAYTSNDVAYGVFLRALDLMQYTRGSEDPSFDDARGFCPEGNLYTFEILDGDNQIQRFWRTTCGEGSFAGNAAKVEDLFQAQIPNYGKFVRKVEL